MKTRKAKDELCYCGKQAVSFWPVIDPDIPSHPYCRKHLDTVKMKLLMELNDRKFLDNKD